VRLTALRKDFVRLCSSYLNRKQLKRQTDRKALRMVIADHLEEIMTQEGSLADDDLRVLFKRIHGIDFQRAEREGFEERRSAIEDLFADAGMTLILET